MSAPGNVLWTCALVFAACSIVGAGLGLTIGKSFDGQRLLFLFGLLMIVIALLMGSTTIFVRFGARR